jgi:hypothetical protein
MTNPSNDTFENLPQSIHDLVALRARLREVNAQSADLLRIEEAIRSALDGVGRALLGEVLAAADIDEQEVLINGTLYGRVDRNTVTIHSTFGPIEVEQTVYGRGRGFALVAPMEKQLGFVETYYTPKCARVLCHLAAVTVRQETEEVLHELGGIGVGAATMHRLPLAVMARYERDRDIIEPAVRRRAKVPADAVSMQVGLDGVMVPQDGEYCDPRGRESKGDPDPPRHERKYGVLEAGPAASDGHEGTAWHEASVGTIAYYDAKGNHLSTTYIGRMPQEKKQILGEMLRDEALHALTLRPDLVPVLASDGAQGQWETLARIHEQLPEEARARARWLLDFFHAAEHLQDACDVIDKKGSAKAKVRRQTLAETLKVYPDGAERVLQSLRHYRRSARSERARDELDSVIGYFVNNNHRMAYFDAIEANVPIATGATEAAAKTLVGVRMKRSGARFSQHGGQTILTLRAALKSGRFGNLLTIVAKSYRATVVRKVA